MGRYNRAALLAALLAGASAQAQTQTFDAAAAFGAREEVTDISLSPDGRTLALVRSLPTGGERLETVATAGGEPKALMTSRSDQRIAGCLWASSTRVICSIYAVASLDGTKLGSRRQLAVDADGGNPKVLNTLSDRALGILQFDGAVIDLLPDADSGEVLMTKAVIPEDMAGTRIGQQKQGVGVEQINTATMRRKLVEQPRIEGEVFITDGHGKVRVIGDRIMSNGQLTDRVNYCYRPAGGGQCSVLSVSNNDEGFRPVAVDREANVAYGFDKQDGRQALFKIALDGSMKRDLVLANPRVDVDGLVRIGRQRRVVGVSYAEEARTTEMFDPALAKLSASLSRALPGKPSVAVVDASLDETKLLIRADSETNPGRYYLYDKATRELNELVSIRPPLDAVKLATVKPVNFPAADGVMIPGYLTLPAGSDGKNLPAIVMPHGGPGARDELGFDWWAQYFANRGFAVLQPNYRGSTGYGDAWYQKNGFQSWRTAIGDVNDAGRWLQKQGIAAPGKLAIVGWSYGGYAALQSSVLDPDLFKAIVAVAPVTDLETLRTEHRDFLDASLVERFIGHGAHVREGSPAQNVAKIKAPVLMFHGDQDLNVGVGESRLMADRLKAAGKPVELVVYPGFDHQLYDDKTRVDMLRKSDAFLRKSLGM